MPPLEPAVQEKPGFAPAPKTVPPPPKPTLPELVPEAGPAPKAVPPPPESTLPRTVPEAGPAPQAVLPPPKPTLPEMVPQARPAPIPGPVPFTPQEPSSAPRPSIDANLIASSEAKGGSKIKPPQPSLWVPSPPKKPAGDVPITFKGLSVPSITRVESLDVSTAREKEVPAMPEVPPEAFQEAGLSEELSPKGPIPVSMIYLISNN